jgi:hypothetical protein
MPLASTSLAIVRAIKEAAFGVTPTTGNPSVLRCTAESLNFDISKTSSAEINASRTINSKIPTSAKAGGGLTMEMRAIGIEPFFESAMQSTFTKFGTEGLGVATPTDSITATTITATSATTGTSLFTNLALGQWFRLVSAGANSGKILRVSPTVAPTATVLTLDPSTPATVSAGESIQIQAARLTHGSTQSSWTIEKESADIGVFIAYRGQTPDKFTMKVASGSLTETTFEFVGKDAIEADATTLPGTPVASDSFEIHSGVSGATNAIWMDGAPVTGTYVKSLDLSFANSLRSQEAIGSLGAVAVGSGTIDCTINAQIYFANKDTFTKYRTNTNQSISFATTDAEGNGYIVSLPACNISTWKSSAGAKDQDQMVDITYTALSDDSNPVVALRKLMFIDRVGTAG